MTQYNAIVGEDVTFTLYADYYGIYDKYPELIMIEDMDGNEILSIRNIQKNDTRKTWYRDFTIPEDMSPGIYNIRWVYRNNPYGDVREHLDTLHLHAVPDIDQFNSSTELYVRILPYTIISGTTKYVDIDVECPRIDVVPKLEARIIDDYLNDIVKDWHELECVDIKKFRMYIDDIKLEPKPYIVDTRIVWKGQTLTTILPYVLHISKRRFGIDSI